MQAGCFIFLVGHEKPRYVEDFLRSLPMLKQNYLDKYPAPVIGFHRAGLSAETRNMIVERTGVAVQWEEICLQVPAWIDQRLIPSIPYTPEYMNMARWMSGQYMCHPALADFEYICRLDTDSFITAPVKKDLFATMQANGWWYGYMNAGIKEYEDFTIGTREAIAEFIENNPRLQVHTPLFVLPHGQLYYTNFEVIRREWFQASLWQQYFVHMDATGGFYYHRWSDCLIRYLGVRTFMPRERIGFVNFIPYDHQGHGSYE